MAGTLGVRVGATGTGKERGVCLCRRRGACEGFRWEWS